MHYVEEEQRPKVLGARSLAVALVIHGLFFGCCWLLSMPFREKEIVIPIELTFEAPPSAQDEPKPEPPKPVVKPKEPEPEPPKLDDKKLDAVIKDPPKKKPPKKPEVKKPEKPKEPEKPKKTKEQLRKERLDRMRQSTTKDTTQPVKKSPAPSGTGKTLEKDWQKLLAQGYKPGEKTQLAANETQRCISLIRAAFHRQWEPPAWNSSMKMMYLEVTFDNGGRVVGYRLVQSSGDGKADQSVLSAASRVGSVAGLSLDFLEHNKTVRIDFKVTPQ